LFNFSHEIPCPEDRAMRKFLWSDYFHDSMLLRIEPDGVTLCITLRSERDTDALWPTLPGTREEKLVQLDALAPRLTYTLRFHGTQQYRYTLEGMPYHKDEFLNARFKDTPLLRRLQEQSGKPLYHLRIQTACGLIDVVFERFTLRKQEGRVSYRLLWTIQHEEGFDSLMKPRPGEADQPITPDTDDGDLDDILCARLYERHHAQDLPGTVALARETLHTYRGRLWLAEPYAAMLLGLYGDESDLPTLEAMYLTSDLHQISRAHVMDAIERIRERRQTHA